MKNTEIIFSILRNTLFGDAIDDETQNELLENLDEIHQMSRRHDVAHLVSYAVEKNKIPIVRDESTKKFRMRHPIALLRYDALNQVYQQMCEVFEENEIPYIPLKGSVIRDFYPEPWMRTSCDIDVLVHEEDVDKASKLLEEKCLCEKKESGTHDISFFSPNGTHIELHFRLAEVFYKSNAEEILDRVWDYADVKEGFKYHYVLRDDFYYMFHIYHMAKHFEVGGCGIRPLIDLYILDTKVEHDEKAREKMLSETNLLEFASACRRLNDYWFCDKEADDTVVKLEYYIFSGGVYGSIGNRKTLKSAKTDNKLAYLLERIFLSYDKLVIQFPIIKKHKWLTPVCEVLRWFKLFNPKYRKVAKDDIDIATSKITGDSLKMEAFLKEIGLK